MSEILKIEVDFDETSKDYYMILEKLNSIGSGKTKIDALLDLKEALNCYIDTLIHQKIKAILR